MQPCRRGVDPVDRVALAQREIHIAAAVHGERARPVERSPTQRRAIRCRASLARARIRLDDAGAQVDAADAMIADVADQEAALRIEGQAVRHSQRCGRGWTAVAAEPWLAGARDGGNDSGAARYFANHVVVALG